MKNKMENKIQNISMRDALFDRLYEIAKNDKDVVIVSADMGAPSLDKFRKDLSGQFVNIGIAEQNAILISAGLALSGKKVFAYAIAPFITLRCYEQIKIELAAMNLPVTIVGVGAGLGYDDSGPTHHTTEDLAIMRVLPNMTINNITDSVMANAFADISCKTSGPNYLRLDREKLPNIYKKGHDFSEGVTVLKKSKDIYIVATGNMVHRALEVSDELKKHSIDAGVIDLYTLPINEKLFLEAIANAKKIITLEEHILYGGMGSAVLEVLADNNKLIPVKRFGLDLRNGYCYKYGGRKHMQSLYGLDAQSITKAIYEKRKK
jgi:transketolase